MAFTPAHRKKRQPLDKAKLAPRVHVPPAKNETCGHCGRTDVGSYAAGSSAVGNQRLCHPNEAGRPDCYRLVTVYKHPVPCDCARPKEPA